MSTAQPAALPLARRVHTEAPAPQLARSSRLEDTLSTSPLPHLQSGSALRSTAEHVRGQSAWVLQGLTGALGDPDEAIVRVTRRPLMWASMYAVWLAVLGCFAAGGYSAPRTIALAGLLLAVLLVAIGVALLRPGATTLRRIAVALPWAVAIQTVVMAAFTGGLHSPFALSLFGIFSAIYGRYGWSPQGRTVFVVCGVGVVWMALAPRAWIGPPHADPWFAVAASVAAMGWVGVLAQFVGALRQTAATAIRETLRTRDELAEHALARARELELVGSKLSHELKNPLAAIKTLVQVAHRSTLDPMIEEQLGVVEREIQRVAGILHAHLGFSRPLEHLDPVDLELGDLAESVVALLEVRAKAAAVALARTGTARVIADPRQLRGALLNLVANAIEACPRGGRVEIAIAEHGGDVGVAVVDDGHGMTPEVAQRVGTPFFTTRERGTGLGIVLARAAFEQHGGTLEYRSVPGNGTTVLGTLPRAPAR